MMKKISPLQMMIEYYTHISGDDIKKVKQEIGTVIKCGVNLYFPAARLSSSIVAPEVRDLYVHTMAVAKELGLERNIKIISSTRERMDYSSNINYYISFDILQYRELGFDTATVDQLVLLPFSLDSMRQVVKIIALMEYGDNLFLNIHNFAKRMLIFVEPFEFMYKYEYLNRPSRDLTGIYRSTLLDMMESSKLEEYNSVVQMYNFYLSLKLINPTILNTHPIWIQIGKISSNIYIKKFYEYIKQAVEAEFPLDIQEPCFCNQFYSLEENKEFLMNGLENINDPKIEKVTKPLIITLFSRSIFPRISISEDQISFRLKERSIMEYMYFYRSTSPISLKPLITYKDNKKCIDWRYTSIIDGMEFVLFEFNFIPGVYGIWIPEDFDETNLATILQIRLNDNDADYQIRF